MARVKFFAAAKDAAGTGSDDIDAPSVRDLVTVAVERYGPTFAAIVPTCTLWVNGDPADVDATITAGDEVAFLPPVSGGS